MNLDEVLAVIETVIPTMNGWCPVPKAKRLARLCADKPVRVGVELGVFAGRSLIAMAFGCSVNGFGHVEGVDPYDKRASLEGANDSANDDWWRSLDYDVIMREAIGAIARHELGPYVSVVRARSLDVVGRYADASVDVIHQDSNHSEEISCAEVRAFAPKVAPGGFWVMDDINWSTTKRAQELLAEIGFRRIEEYESWAIFQGNLSQ